MTESSHDPLFIARRRRLRERVFPALSLVAAALCAWGTWDLAARVRDYNSSRAVGALITSGMMGSSNARPSTGPADSAGARIPSRTHLSEESLTGPASAPAVNERTGLPWISFPPVADPADASAAEASGLLPESASPPANYDVIRDMPKPLSVSELTRASSVAETVVYGWEIVQYALAALLALAGLIGLTTAWVRGPHLLAAGAILVATAATLAAMRLLVAPWGGAFHPLPLTSYALAGIGQSLYGLVLLVVFAPKSAPGSR